MLHLAEFYKAAILEFGDDPRAVGWTDAHHQSERFRILDGVVRPGDRVLDVGCGLGHFYLHLKQRGFAGDYVGIDELPEMVEIAQRAGRPVRLAQLGDLADADRYDVVVASGVVSTQLGTDAERRAFLDRFLRQATERSRRVLAFNFLCDDEDPPPADRWFPPAGDVLEAVLRVADDVCVRRDYLGGIDCTFLVRVRGGDA